MTFLNYMTQYRQINVALFLTPLLMLSYGYYMQYVMELEPCALCMTQRICFYLIAIAAFFALFNHRSTVFKGITASFGALFSLTGMLVAGRQLWLQSLPEDQVPACGPSFDYIIESFPLLEALEIMFKGNGNCAEVVWQFMGLSIPGWSFIAFTLYASLNLYQLFRKL